MNRELIVNVNPTEISIALCEDKVLVELNKEQCQTGFSVGDIYLGKVRKIMPGLNAAFVNIGHEKDAFIHYLDLGSQFPSLQKLVASQQPGKRGMRVEGMKLEPPVEKTGKIGDYLQVGQNIMVQIAKEAISTKGPRLTSDISLAGRNVVLVPFSSKVFLSQKIRSADEKKRLKRIAAAVLPKNFGVIIRTAAMEAKDEDIEHDIQSQIDRWRKTCAAIKKSTPPAQLMSEMNRANTIIRDSLNGSFSQIAVDDEHDTVRHREALPRRLDHDLAELASGLAAQGVHAGRVHKNDLGILLGQDADDAVTGRLRLGRDDRHLLAHKGVGKGGFARIGRTHQRYPSTTVCCCHIVSSKTQKCWFHTSASERDVIKSQDAESAISWAGRRIRHSPGRTSTTSSSHTPSSRYTRQRPGRSS